MSADDVGAAGDLTVVSLNIRTSRGLDGRNAWWFRRRVLADLIERLAPDVAALQEVRRGARRYLEARLPGYGFLGRGRGDGGSRGEQCPILYRRDRFEPSRWEVRWFAEDHRGRIATLALVDDREGGAGTFAVAATHLDYRSAAVRLNSATTLARWLMERDVPWIVMGDFNATSADASVAALLQAGLRDALSAVPAQGAGVSTSHNFTGSRHGRRIDHILVSAVFEVVEARIVRTGEGERVPSDHWPVLARLRRSDGAT